MVTSDSRLTSDVAQGARSFYTKALSEAERESLAEALNVVGLDDEIELIRSRLFKAVDKQPEDLRLMFEGAALLSRLVATKFKLSQADAGDLKQAIEYAVAALSEMGREADDACNA